MRDLHHAHAGEARATSNAIAQVTLAIDGLMGFETVIGEEPAVVTDDDDSRLRLAKKLRTIATRQPVDIARPTKSSCAASSIEQHRGGDRLRRSERA